MEAVYLQVYIDGSDRHVMARLVIQKMEEPAHIRSPDAAAPPPEGVVARRDSRGEGIELAGKLCAVPARSLSPNALAMGPGFECPSDPDWPAAARSAHNSLNRKRFGVPARTRTEDHSIKSRMLYQLSYGHPGDRIEAGGPAAVAHGRHRGMPGAQQGRA